MALRMTTSSKSVRTAARGVALFLLLAAILVTTLARLRGPEPHVAPDALGIIHSLLAENVPHPVESAANRVVRDRIIAHFSALGFRPVVQRARACSKRWGRCANVENIVVLPDRAADIVLGVAHYDSTPNGPGASDDAVGVAAMLECANLLRNVQTRNPIGFLITDGEEAGLLGAEAFVADPVLSRNVRAVVNVEDRGTAGPSYLFETSKNNRDLVPLFNRLSKTVTTSVFYTVYTLLPNDTDVTVFKRAGKICVNFAAIGGVENYHRATDDLAHVDKRTLEHHIENALGMLRALGDADLGAMRRGDAVFFDVFGYHVFWWPASWTIWFAIATLVVLVVLMRGIAGRDIAMTLLRFLGAIVIAAIIGVIAMKLTPHRVAHPELLIAAMWLAGIVSSLILLRGKPWQGRALLWTIIAIALALTLPGLSFLFLVPAIAMLIPGRPFIGAAAAAILFFPLGLVLYTALGGLALPVVAVLLTFVASAF